MMHLKSILGIIFRLNKPFVAQRLSDKYSFKFAVVVMWNLDLFYVKYFKAYYTNPIYNGEYTAFSYNHRALPTA